ncbi:MAG: WD40/YVTN/BNR-like repeat-containing protein, partial [bacterium]
MAYQKIYILMLLFSFSTAAHSQAWMKDLPEKKSFNQSGRFYQVQDAFEHYWEDKEIQKGKGWKQFKRWEDFMEPRVYPYGYMSLPFIKPVLKSFREEGNLPADWRSLGPEIIPPIIYADKNSGAGRLNTVAFHPVNSDIMWVGAPSGGVWKTTDGGNNWVSLTDELFSIGVSDIAVNPSNPNRIYIATGDGDGGDTYGIGILRSRDGGNTWETTALQTNVSERIYFRRLLIDPLNPNVLIAASNNGIYRTTDGFETYEIVRSGHFKDLEFQPGNPDIVYAASYNYRGVAAIYRSVDNGRNFLPVQVTDIEGNVSRIELAVTPDNPDVVYALASDAKDDGFYGLYKSIDEGLNFNKKYGREDKNLLGWSFDGS